MLNRVICVLVDNSLPQSTIKEIYEKYDGVKFIISNNQDDKGICDVISYKEIDEICASNKQGKFTRFEDIDDDDIVQILFTTGTTGKSKGVCWTYSSIYYSDFVPGCMPLDDHHKAIIIAKNNHTLGIGVANDFLVRNGSVVQLENFSNPKLFFEKAEEFNINALVMTPSAMSFLFLTSIDLIHFLAPKIDLIEFTGEKMPVQTEIEAKQIFKNSKLLIAYGSTETGHLGIYEFSKYGESERRIMKVEEYPSVHFFDENKNEMTPSKDNPGLIALKMPFKLAGYYKEDELNKELIYKDYTVMSDLGYIDEEGFLCLCGRAGDVIITGAFKVNPTDVEQAAHKSNMIKDCVCYGVSDEIFGKLVTLDVVIKDNFNKKFFKQFLKENLERNQWPRTINVVDSVKRNIGGKIDRKYYRER